MTDKPSFEWKFGPAFIAVAIQTIGGVVAVTLLYSSLMNTAVNTEKSAERLSIIIDKIQETQTRTGERLIRVETTLTALENTIVRLDKKVDEIRKN